MIGDLLASLQSNPAIDKVADTASELALPSKMFSSALQAVDSGAPAEVVALSPVLNEKALLSSLVKEPVGVVESNSMAAGEALNVSTSKAEGEVSVKGIAPALHAVLLAGYGAAKLSAEGVDVTKERVLLASDLIDAVNLNDSGLVVGDALAAKSSSGVNLDLKGVFDAKSEQVPFLDYSLVAKSDTSTLAGKFDANVLEYSPSDSVGVMPVFTGSAFSNKDVIGDMFVSNESGFAQGVVNAPSISSLSIANVEQIEPIEFVGIGLSSGSAVVSLSLPLKSDLQFKSLDAPVSYQFTDRVLGSKSNQYNDALITKMKLDNSERFFDANSVGDLESFSGLKFSVSKSEPLMQPLAFSQSLLPQYSPQILESSSFVSFKVVTVNDTKHSPVIETTLSDLGSKIKEAISGNQSSLSIKLKPYELGRIDVQLKDVSGELQIFFKAEKPSAVDALQSNEGLLRNAFKDGESLSLSYGGFGKGGSGKGDQGAGGDADYSGLKSLEVDDLDAQVEFSGQESRGLNVIV